MKRIILITTVCACGLLPLQAQSVDEVLQSVAQHNKSIQAQQKNGEAEKIGIEAENSLEDPTVEYSSFFSKGVNGQSGSELVVSQGFDFPTVYNSRNRAGRDKKEAVDYRAEALRRNVLLEAKTLCLDMIRLNRQRDLLDKRMQNADIQTEVLQNHTDHRTALQSLLALNGNMPLTFEGREYPTIPTTLDFEALCDEVLGQDAELKAAEADTRAAERNLTVNRQKWLPKLEIGYRRNTGEGSKEHGFLVGGSIPLFSNRRQVRMAQAQSIGTRLQADEIRLKAEAALHSGFNELQQLGRAMSVYDQPLMTQTLELLKESVKGGELSVTDYFVEADQIYRNLQAYMELECQYQKVAATLYKNRL